eukprot:6465153-Lingulodinium_polyedra.AAC.1
MEPWTGSAGLSTAGMPLGVGGFAASAEACAVEPCITSHVCCTAGPSDSGPTVAWPAGPSASI